MHAHSIKIEPAFDGQALAVICGFIQRIRIDGNDNFPFVINIAWKIPSVTKIAWKSSLYRVFSMVPREVIPPQRFYNFNIGACA